MKLTECPHCGFNEYYVVTYMSGRGIYHYNFNGEIGEDNGAMHDNLNYKEFKTMYCSNCHKKLGIKKELLK